jgi:myo-inositol-1(or 4)-monophosphatase
MTSYLEAAAEIGREAGNLLVNYFNSRIGYELKGEADLVTAADRASETLIVERLLARFPQHSIMAEEGGGREGSSEYRWYVDPLDGTTNFAHGFPAFCVSIGLERAGEMIAGVVYDPGRDEMFTAEKGAGAWLNYHPLRVSKTGRLADALLATGFPSYKRHKSLNIHYFHQVAMLSHGVRRAGSAALDLAYVAAGRLDGFWEFGLKPWDMAAGLLLVTEAGGIISDVAGAPHRLDCPHLLADNGTIHEEVLNLFREVAQGRYRVPLPQVGAAGD